MEGREICLQNVGSLFSGNILPALGDHSDVGRTHLPCYLRKYQFSALLPITRKKRIRSDLGQHVHARRGGGMATGSRGPRGSGDSGTV